MKQRYKRRRAASTSPVHNEATAHFNPLLADPTSTSNLRQQLVNELAQSYPLYLNQSLLAANTFNPAEMRGPRGEWAPGGATTTPAAAAAGAMLARSPLGAAASVLGAGQEAREQQAEAVKKAMEPVEKIVEEAKKQQEEANKEPVPAVLGLTVPSFNYDPNQPRDEMGQWVKVGGVEVAPSAIGEVTGYPGHRFPLKPQHLLGRKVDPDKWTEAEKHGYDLLHGTASKSLRSILKYGIDPAHKSQGADAWAAQHGIGFAQNREINGRKASVYMTDDPEYARQFASAAANVTGGKPVILEAVVPTRYRNRFHRDEADLSGRAVRYEGKIWPQWIKRLWRTEPTALPSVGETVDGNLIDVTGNEAIDGQRIYLVVLLADPADMAFVPTRNFDPNEARDDHGRWTAGGSSGSGHSSQSITGKDLPFKRDPEDERQAQERTVRRQEHEKVVAQPLVYRGPSTNRAEELTRVETAFHDSIAQSGVYGKQQQGYERALHDVVQNLPETALRTLEKGLGGVAWHADLESVEDKLDALSGRRGSHYGVMAFYNPGRRDVNWDGSGERLQERGQPGEYEDRSTAGTYAHELTHALDHFTNPPGRSDSPLSRTQEWKWAYAFEIGVPDNKGHYPLSRYAGTNDEEGFAEFGRLLYTAKTPLSEVVQRFPQCSQFFQQHGLWPVRRDKFIGNVAAPVFSTNSGQLLPDIFNTGGRAEDGSLWDGWDDEHGDDEIFNRDGRPLLAVDMDGTLVNTPQHSKYGPPPPLDALSPKTLDLGDGREVRLIDCVKAAARDGYRILIWTGRDDVAEIASWLRKWDVPYESINYRSDQPTASPKIVATHYIDDRALSPQEFARSIIGGTPLVTHNILGNYDSNEARDEKGRWTATLATGKPPEEKSASQRVGFHSKADMSDRLQQAGIPATVRSQWEALNPNGAEHGEYKVDYANAGKYAVELIRAKPDDVMIHVLSGPKGAAASVAREQASAGKEVASKVQLDNLPDDPATSSLRLGSVTSKETLMGGCNGSYRVTFDNGKEACWKPADEEDLNLRLGVPPGMEFKREAAAYAVAKALGMADLVPPTTLREIDGKIGSVQEWQTNARVAKRLYDSEKYDGEEDLKRAAALDFIMGNSDRHAGNWMIGDRSGKLRLIDNGLSFPINYSDTDANQNILEEAALRREWKDNKVSVGYKIPKDWANLIDRWPAVKEALKRTGIEPEAIRLTHNRLIDFTEAAARGDSFNHLPPLFTGNFGGASSSSSSHDPLWRLHYLIPKEEDRRRIHDLNPKGVATAITSEIRVPEDIYAAHKVGLKIVFPHQEIVPVGTAIQSTRHGR